MTKPTKAQRSAAAKRGWRTRKTGYSAGRISKKTRVYTAIWSSPTRAGAQRIARNIRQLRKARGVPVKILITSEQFPTGKMWIVTATGP